MAVNKSLFAKNSLSGLLQKLLVACLTFYAIPVFISKLGTHSYGIWATLSVLGDLQKLTNLGFNMALIKFVSAQGKTRESSQDIVVGFFSTLFFLVIVSAIVLMFKEFILSNVFSIPDNDLESSRVLFNYLLYSTVLMMAIMPINAVLESMKKIYLVNLFQLIYSILYWGLIIIVLKFGYGLEQVGLVVFIAAVLWFVITIIFALKEWGKFDLKGFWEYVPISIKKQLGYSSKVYLSAILGFFLEPLTKILVARFFGVEIVGYLQIAIRVKEQLFRMLRQSLWPLFQLFSEKKDKKDIARIVKDLQEKIFIFLVPLSVGLFFVTKSVVILWMPDEGNVDIITASIQIMTIGTLLGITTLLPMTFYLSAHSPLTLSLDTVTQIIAIIIPVALLHEQFGIYSIYIGFGFSYIVHFIQTLIFQKYFLKNAIFNTFSDILKIVAYTVVLFIVGYLISLKTQDSPLQNILLTGVSIGVLVPVLLYVFKVINKEDIDRYLNKNSRIGNLLIKIYR